MTEMVRLRSGGRNSSFIGAESSPWSEAGPAKKKARQVSHAGPYITDIEAELDLR
jgi:hypothetical protein